MTIAERPEGLVIALVFVAMILVTSVVSRISRSTELRVQRVALDAAAQRLLDAAYRGPQPLRFIANRLDAGDDSEYDEKSYDVRVDNHLTDGGTRSSSRLSSPTPATSRPRSRSARPRSAGTGSSARSARRCRMSSRPSASTCATSAGFRRTCTRSGAKAPGSTPCDSSSRGGDIPTLTHEILRRAVADPNRRPVVHVGG